MNLAVANSLRETVAGLEAKTQQFAHLARMALLRDPYYIAACPESGATVGCDAWDRFPPLWSTYEQALAEAEADSRFRVVTEEQYFRRAAQKAAQAAEAVRDALGVQA